AVFWQKGESYETNGEYEKSFECYKKGFDVSSSLNYSSITSSVEYKMGNLYRDVGDYETAMGYYREAKEHALSNHLQFFAQAEIDKETGILYSLKGQYDSALFYLHRAKALYGRRNRDIQIAIGETYFQQKKYREALALFSPLLENFRRANDIPL